MGTHPIFESDFDCLTEMDGLQVQSQIEAQILQMQLMQDQYKRLQSSCEFKCVSEKYKESCLTKIEAVCIDNCVKKFMDFNHHVTIQLREMQEPQTLMMLDQQAQELGRQAGL